MKKNENNALLPAGFRDVLPPDAAFEEQLANQLVKYFSLRGYNRIKPPLMEFEEGLLSGTGVALAPQTFRLMDPISQRMMGIRADITPQIARVALSRLKTWPRPLRLSYAGEVLRVRGSQLLPDRQLYQVGAEMIGSEMPSADAEIICMVLDSILDVGVSDICLDLNVPPLVSHVLAQFGVVGEEYLKVREALDRKDRSFSSLISKEASDILIAMLDATGSIEFALEKLEVIDLPPSAAKERSRLKDVVSLLKASKIPVTLTLDPIENRGFEYHTGIGFTVFAKGFSSELANGGRYKVQNVEKQKTQSESGTGVTLYVGTIINTLKKRNKPQTILIPQGTSKDLIAGLHSEGWVTIAALESGIELAGEAQRLKCTHFLGLNGPEPLLN